MLLSELQTQRTAKDCLVSCLACVDIGLVLQICNVSRQVAGSWRHAELVFQQELLLQLGIVLAEFGDCSPVWLLYVSGTYAKDYCKSVKGNIPLFHKELLSLSKNAVLAFAKCCCACNACAVTRNCTVGKLHAERPANQTDLPLASLP